MAVTTTPNFTLCETGFEHQFVDGICVECSQPVAACIDRKADLVADVMDRTRRFRDAVAENDVST